MQKINGNYASAVVFTENIEDYAKAQIKMICDSETAKGSKIRIMPDVHPGKVGPIGLTMTITDKVIPNLVGTDIGCGISFVRIGKKAVEFQKLDKVIRECVPTGSEVRKEPHINSDNFSFDDLICGRSVNSEKGKLSLGTLGSGNHFIELDKDEEGNLYLVVHSGSRHVGVEVTEHYLRKGQKALKKSGIAVPYEMTWLDGELMQDYLQDVRTVQRYAMLNSEIILKEICKKMKWKVDYFGESIHNYVDENKVLRKGACSAHKDEDVIIPINMRDGIILGTGKGNVEWNCSAPHGAGRIMRRDEVRKTHTVSEFKGLMDGIYCSIICKETLDEAPFAYRGIEEICENIKSTVDVKKILKPVYNYKAVGVKGGR